MTTLNGQSEDILKDNIAALRELFPEVCCEGKVNFDKLKQVLGDYTDDSAERYNFTWNGKGQALRLSQTPSMGTLRPCKEESKNWDDTQNLYIEGDNLEVLKLLQKSYHGKIKMIYIDPPYNTGGDFVYPDDFSDSIENYKEITGQVDAEGRKVSTNSEANGRYHTDWLNMMYPRLRLARNLLTEDGVIFISIDDNEVDNLKKICNEVFGEDNFLADVIWKHTQQSKNDELYFSRQYNHTLSFCKSRVSLSPFSFERTDEDNKNYSNPDNDPKGLWRSGDVRSPNYRKTLCFPIVAPNGTLINPPENGWRWSEDSIEEKISTGEIKFKEDNSGIVRKIYLCEQSGRTPENLWEGPRFGTTRQAAATIKALFDGVQIFDTPKPYELVTKMMEVLNCKDSYVLDFFSGSATTAHAVMQLNAEDGGNRRFIMVQLPEPCAEGTEAAKAGYKNICEIGKERIRRAGEKIKTEVEEQNAQMKLGEEPKKVPDIGFKDFKLDTSNLKKWQPDADNLEQSLFDSISNYVDGRTELDVVYEIMLKMGLDLTWPLETRTYGGKNVYAIGMGALMICLDDHITPDVAEGMVLLHKELAPETWKVVFKDNGFADDSAKVNIKEILKCAGLDEDAFATV
jgi:adenine-specific DNA-methyltransferase